jgi:hypothetical protein
MHRPRVQRGSNPFRRGAVRRSLLRHRTASGLPSPAMSESAAKGRRTEKILLRIVGGAGWQARRRVDGCSSGWDLVGKVVAVAVGGDEGAPHLPALKRRLLPSAPNACVPHMFGTWPR